MHRRVPGRTVVARRRRGGVRRPDCGVLEALPRATHRSSACPWSGIPCEPSGGYPWPATGTRPVRATVRAHSEPHEVPGPRTDRDPRPLSPMAQGPVRVAAVRLGRVAPCSRMLTRGLRHDDPQDQVGEFPCAEETGDHEDESDDGRTPSEVAREPGAHADEHAPLPSRWALQLPGHGPLPVGATTQPHPPTHRSATASASVHHPTGVDRDRGRGCRERRVTRLRG
jgi:hypothetical protein